MHAIMGSVETSEKLVRILCLLVIRRMFLVVRKCLIEDDLWGSSLMCLTNSKEDDADDVGGDTEVEEEHSDASPLVCSA